MTLPIAPPTFEKVSEFRSISWFCAWPE